MQTYSNNQSRNKNITENKTAKYRYYRNKNYYKKKNANNTNKNVGETENKANDFSSIVLPNQFISVVIPLYNEIGSLQELSDKLKDVLDSLKCGYEVLFVEDGSTDGSFDKIKEIHSHCNRFHCIKLRKNQGKSAALSVGFKRAKGDIIITMDADLQDDPAEIPELIKIINSGYDLVSGWKKVRYDPFIKKQSSKFFNYVTSKIAGIKLHDFNCGLKAYKKEVIKSIKVYGELHRYIPALANIAGFKVTEKVVQHHARKYGKSKFGTSRFFKGFFDLLTVLFTTRFIKRPLHLFGTLGLISFIFGGFVTLYLTLEKFLFGQSLYNRPLLLIGVMFIIIGVQSFSLGFIGEMITKSSFGEGEDVFIQETF